MNGEPAPADYRPRPFGSPASDSQLASPPIGARSVARGPSADPGIAAPRLRAKWRVRRAISAALGGAIMVGAALAGVFAASPLVTAWSIREAVKTGDAEYLRHRIDWPRIKETLKSSMASYALGLPTPTAAASSEMDETPVAAAPAPRPSLWQRIKNAYGRSVVDGFVESYVTPEGLPKLFSYRKTYHQTIGPRRDLPDDASLVARVRHEWSRLRLARFLSPTRFAIEIDDRYEPGRRIAGILELEGSGLGLGWRLVSLEVKGEPTGTLNRLLNGSRQASLQ